MLETLQWIEGTSLGGIARESLYGFQILVGVHILGLILSVSTLLWVDLRIMGICLPDQPLSEVYRAFSRWFTVGFLVMFVSGISLFAGFASSAYENPYFRLKVAIIMLAGVNAIVFHMLMRRMPAGADSKRPAGSIRAAGMLSIVFWSIVILCGRMMSYTLF